MDEEYLVTALVPSETACLASSPGRMSLTLSKVSEKGCYLDQLEDLRGLNLSGWNGGLLVVCGKLGCLSCYTLEDVCVICKYSRSNAQFNNAYHWRRSSRWTWHGWRYQYLGGLAWGLKSKKLVCIHNPRRDLRLVDGPQCWRSVSRCCCDAIKLAPKQRDLKSDWIRTFVDVGRVCLLAGLGALLLVSSCCGLLSSFLLLSGCLSWRLAGGGLLLCCGLWWHFGWI